MPLICFCFFIFAFLIPHRSLLQGSHSLWMNMVLRTASIHDPHCFSTFTTHSKHPAEQITIIILNHYSFDHIHARQKDLFIKRSVNEVFIKSCSYDSTEEENIIYIPPPPPHTHTKTHTCTPTPTTTSHKYLNSQCTYHSHLEKLGMGGWIHSILSCDTKNESRSHEQVGSCKDQQRFAPSSVSKTAYE